MICIKFLMANSYKGTETEHIFIDREAGEIMYLVASVRLTVCNALLLEPFDL